VILFLWILILVAVQFPLCFVIAFAYCLLSFLNFFILVVQEGTLWYLQKFLQHVIVEFTSSIILFYPLSPIPGIASIDLIFSFTYMWTCSLAVFGTCLIISERGHGSLFYFPAIPSNGEQPMVNVLRSNRMAFLSTQLPLLLDNLLGCLHIQNLKWAS
jgi:hypothetical protein